MTRLWVAKANSIQASAAFCRENSTLNPGMPRRVTFCLNLYPPSLRQHRDLRLQARFRDRAALAHRQDPE